MSYSQSIDNCLGAGRLSESELAATLEQARASVVAAKAQVQQAIEQKGGDNNADNTQLKVAQSAVAKAELDLERTVVKASSRGIITDLKADVGRYSAAGSPVMTLVALHDVWVRVEYTENNLGHLEVGTPVEIVFDVMPGRVYAGEVSSIGLGVSFEQSSTPGVLPSIDNDRDWLRQSQRFPVNVRFKVSRDSELAPRLRIGGQATVMAFSGDSVVLRWLGKGYIRMVSILSYAY